MILAVEKIDANSESVNTAPTCAGHRQRHPSEAEVLILCQTSRLGCIGMIEADEGWEPSSSMVRDEIELGLRLPDGSPADVART